MRSKRLCRLLAVTFIVWSFAPKFNWFVYALNKSDSYLSFSVFNKIASAPPSQIIDQQSDIGIITTVAGNGNEGFSGDNGPAPSASLDFPIGVTIDSSGNLFIADTENNRIRRVNVATGIITTVAGNGNNIFSGDGGSAASASLRFPQGVAIDSSGNLFIADANNNRIRRVDAATGVITTVAGNGNEGFSGDNGPAASASLNIPRSVAIDSSGNLFIADANNNRIRRVDAATGIITTVAGNGNGGFSGDGGPAASASLAFPQSVAIDSSSNLFITDRDNARIRRVNVATGVIMTVAGNGNVGFSGDNGPAASASLFFPQGVAIDSSGNLFIGDSGNFRIRRVNAATGIITTVAGNGNGGFSGDNGPAASASLRFPQGVAIDSSSNLFIADTNNNRIRKVIFSGSTNGDFTLSVSPDSRSVSAGQSATYSVSVQAINGFSQAVNLSASVMPQTSNVSVNFSLSSIAPGNSATMTVNTNPSTATSAFTIIITGSSGQLVQTRSVTLNVSQTAASDFSLMVLPGSQSITAGTATSFMVGVQAIGGFNQSVNLSASISPSNGVTTSFNTTAIAPGGNATLTIASTAGTPPGAYAITVTGAAGQLVRTAIATVNVMSGSASDFSLTAAPTSREITAGGSTTFTVTVNKINGFSETVNLLAIPTPNDQNIRVDAVPPSVSPGGSATLNVTTTQSLRAGAYTINIVGTAGQINKTAAATVNVAEQGYSLSFDKPEITVSPGEKASIAVNINRGGGFNANVTVTPDPLKLKALKIKSTPPSDSSTGSSVTFSFKVKSKASPGRFELVFTGQDDRGGPSRPQTLIIFIK